MGTFQQRCGAGGVRQPVAAASREPRAGGSQAALSQHSWNLQLQPACFLFSFLSTLCRIAWVPRPAKHPIPLALFLPTVGLGVGLMGVVPLPASLGSK